MLPPAWGWLPLPCSSPAAWHCLAAVSNHPQHYNACHCLALPAPAADRPILRPTLREEARKAIGDTGSWLWQLHPAAHSPSRPAAGCPASCVIPELTFFSHYSSNSFPLSLCMQACLTIC